MSTTTANLGLFKYDTTEDAQTAFNLDTALNNNWNILDTAYENTMSAIDTVAQSIPSTSNFVKKNGDTMTGQLAIQRTDWDFTNPVSGHANNYVYFNDKDDDTLACFQQRFGTDYHDFFMRLRPLGDTTTEVAGLPSLGLRNVNGNTYGYCPASAIEGSIITTASISKTTDGYLKFGNGVIIQWGTAEGSNTGTLNTFPLSFSSKTYKIIALNKGNTLDASWLLFSISATQVSKFTLYCNQNNTDVYYIAIGY